MSKPLISYSEFAAKVAEDEEDAFVFADLDRFDYDPPKQRVALVSWCSESVDEDGEVHAGFWRVIMSGSSQKWDALHDWGVLSFGLPPWKRSAVVSVVGRLGSLETFVKDMAEPGPDFEYSFKVDEPLAPLGIRLGGRVSRSAAVEVLSRPRVNERGQERARWARARRPDRSGQGELF